MKSEQAKVLHEIDGKTLLDHVLGTAAALGLDRTIVVIGFQAEEVRRRHEHWGVETVVQEPQLGTGHAVMVAAPLLQREPEETECLVLYGDVPLLRETTLRELMERHVLEGNGVTVLTAEVPDPSGYGRIVRDAGGRFDRIVEDRDLKPEERACREINSGIYVFRLRSLLDALAHLKADNAQKEYYLTDALPEIRRAGGKVGVMLLADPDEISGVNTPAQLAEGEAILARRRADPNEGCPVCRVLRERGDLLLEKAADASVLLAPSPYNSGHLWVAPHRHVLSWLSLPEAQADRLLEMAARAERWLDEAYGPQAFNLGYNSGRPGEHLVLHVIPRWSGDSNFMPLIGGVNILPQSLEGSKRAIEEAKRRLEAASREESQG
jgi:diadenosine tetraphosphate (Ap4A) HIT family hydrolase/choline kinase